MDTLEALTQFLTVLNSNDVAAAGLLMIIATNDGGGPDGQVSQPG